MPQARRRPEDGAREEAALELRDLAPPELAGVGTFRDCNPNPDWRPGSTLEPPRAEVSADRTWPRSSQALRNMLLSEISTGPSFGDDICSVMRNSGNLGSTTAIDGSDDDRESFLWSADADDTEDPDFEQIDSVNEDDDEVDLDDTK